MDIGNDAFSGRCFMAPVSFYRFIIPPIFLYIFGILEFFLAEPRAINCLISFPVKDALYN